MDKKEEFSTTKEYVEAVLKDDLRTRENDHWLIIKTLRLMNYKIYIDYDEIAEMPSFETITRCRRKFQKQGKYQPPAEVKEGRKEAEKQMKAMNKWWRSSDEKRI